MSRKVNFNHDQPLKPIPEHGEKNANHADDDEDDDDTVFSEQSGLTRNHSIHEIVSAKAASRIFRLRSLEARKNRKRDEGFAEQIHADYPLVREDLLLVRNKSTVGSSFRSSSALADDSSVKNNSNNLMRYNMEPVYRFKEIEVKKIIQTVLEENLNNKEYNAENCRFKSRLFADLIKEKVKILFLPRYKFICMVYIGQIGQQALHVASRCCWDTKFDDFAEYTYQNDSLWAVGLVFALYHE